MKIGLFTDLSSWTNERLMLDMRRQFAYSVGVFLMTIGQFMAVVIIVDNHGPQEFAISGFIVLFLLEICTWFSFIRVWRESNRRMLEK